MKPRDHHTFASRVVCVQVAFYHPDVLEQKLEISFSFYNVNLMVYNTKNVWELIW